MVSKTKSPPIVMKPKLPDLPLEIIDKILIHLRNERVAVCLKRFHIVRKINENADFNWAIKNSRLDYLKYLKSSGFIDNDYSITALYHCARDNGLEILKYCHEEIKSISEYTKVMDAAAAMGHLELVKYLHSIGSGCTTDAMDNAAMLGNLKVVKWLHENRQEGCTTKAMDNAATFGHLDVIKWLHENRKEGCTGFAMVYAASDAHFDIVKWLHYNRKEGCTTAAINYAASRGHLEIVKWLCTNRPEGFTVRAIEKAAQNGHEEIVKYLKTIDLHPTA